MRVTGDFLTESVKTENQDAVTEAVAALLRFTRSGYTQTEPPQAGEPEDQPAEPKPKPKPKRKRRTKAEIAADKAAEVAVDPVEETVTADIVVEEENLEAPPSVSEADVKAAVVDCVQRLTKAGRNTPTLVVVKKLVELTGKKRVGEIDSSDYAKVIAGLAGDLPEEDEAEDLF